MYVVGTAFAIIGVLFLGVNSGALVGAQVVDIGPNLTTLLNTALNVAMLALVAKGNADVKTVRDLLVQGSVTVPPARVGDSVAGTVGKREAG